MVALASKLFDVMDDEGRHLFVCAASILEAYQAYQAWRKEWNPDARWVEPESIVEAGDLITRSLE